MRALSLAAASLALGAAQFVPTPCSSTFDCASGSACTAWRNGSQCVSLTTGATPCLAYTSEPGAAAFLPYGAFGAANRRTGVLFRVNTCGGGGGSAAQSSIALFPPGASTFELREDFGADFAALSADSTSWWQDSIGSAPVAVNELYRARVLLLLDLLGLGSDLLVELRPDLPKVLLMEGELELQLLHMLPQLPFLRVILLSDGADQGLVL
jgi:hypothetical protein